MKQGHIVLLSRKKLPHNINIVFCSFKKKLFKIFMHHPFFLQNCSIFSYKHFLFLNSNNLGTIHKFLRLLQFLDPNNFFLRKLKKKQIINRFGIYKIDISEEKLLKKDENRQRIFRKLGNRYKSKDREYDSTSFSKTFDVGVFKKNTYKYTCLYKISLPNKNIITNAFFFNICLYYLKNYKSFLKNIFFSFNVRIFIFFCLILNSINLNIKINYYSLQYANYTSSRF